MDKNIDKEKMVTIQQIADHVNNAALNDELIVFDGFNPSVTEYNESFPLRIDAMIIVLCINGTGKIGIDLNEYMIKRGTLILMQPKNYITFAETSDDFNARVVACSRNIIEHSMPKLTDILPILISHRTEPVMDLSETDTNGLYGFFNFLKLKLEGEHTTFLKNKVICVLQAAMYEIMDIKCKSGITPNLAKTRKEEIMAKFIISVSENFRKERQVSFYADDLCITPKHLSAVIKEISGRTAGEWIENYVTMESKVLLRTTDLTIQEIASKLNFTNQSFFGKYFKHQTGLSPTEFRNSQNKAQ